MPELQLTEVRKHLLTNLGLDFTESREKELYKKLVHAAKEFNYKTTELFIDWIVNNHISPKEIERLAAFLTVGETYFNREKKALDYLEYEYLPNLVHKRRGKEQRIRIWSAGCASGEEPYSIAMILKRVIPNIKNWDITIMGTDINTVCLNKARAGIYTKWSFRGTNESLKTNYFKQIEKDKFRIQSGINKMVTFSYQNLAKDTYPSLVNNTNAMDVVLCRNVLIYFSNQGIQEVTARLYNCLTNGGILLVSPVETSTLISKKFKHFQYQGITIYNKGAQTTTKAYKPTYDWEIPSRDVIAETPVPPPSTLVPEPQQETTELTEFEKAHSLFKKGLFDEAEAILSNILNYTRENIKPNILLLAKIKANLGKLDDAEQLCKKAIKIDKLDPVVYYLLASILGESGKEEEAIKMLTNTLFLDPDFTLAWFLLGNYSVKSGKRAESKKHFRNALNTLSKFNADDEIPESDGLTAGRLSEIITTMKG